MIIFVGSSNPVKVNAVKQAVISHWPDAQVEGFEVKSGVDAQPRTDKETRQGAENRALAALQQGVIELQNSGKKFDKTQLLGVGLEGGVFTQGKELWSTVWGAVTDMEGRMFPVNGMRMRLPKILADQIAAGGEMGPVVAEVVGIEDVRQKQGMIGVVTNNFVTRTDEYGNIAKLAIGLWYGRDWNKK
jgi:inosine/xanthosine triphosphatase